MPPQTEKSPIVLALDAFFSNIGEQPKHWRVILAVVFASAFFPLYYIFQPHVFLFNDTPVSSSGRLEYIHLNNFLFYGHILTALPALLIGPWMFHSGFRTRHLNWHRKLGEVYIYCCLLSAVTSLPLGLKHFSGTLPSIGFSSLAIVWYAVTTLAFSKAIQKDFVAHRKWMMRSYACTFAFVNVKLLSLSEAIFHLDIPPLTIKVLQSYASWMINLAIVEIYLSRTTHSGKRRKNKKKQNNNST